MLIVNLLKLVETCSSALFPNFDETEPVKREFNKLEENYNRIRELYEIEDNQLQLYAPESEPSSLSTFIHTQGFLHTELRSALLFVILGTSFDVLSRHKLNFDLKTSISATIL